MAKTTGYGLKGEGSPLTEQDASEEVQPGLREAGRSVQPGHEPGQSQRWQQSLR